MKLHVDYIPPRSPFLIDHDSNLLLLGSCFAENIGTRLIDHCFRCLINPCGIVFNPLSLAWHINTSISASDISADYFIQRDQSWFSYMHHSHINANSPEALASKIRSAHAELKKGIESATTIFLTFGSAQAYVIRNSDRVVANCHKQPQSVFDKKLLSADKIIAQWKQTIELIRKVNPSVSIVFTVSPVKYLRDGLIQNALSKAILLQSAHAICETSDCHYFPAYELLAEDLRDHRFYQEDLAHPNELAIQYIWEKFGDVFFSAHTAKVNNEIARLNRARQHRSIHGTPSELSSLESFIKDTKDKIKTLQPGIKL